MSYTIDVSTIMRLDDDRFLQLCLANPEVKFERNAREELIIMSPTGGETGRINAGINAKLWFWNQQQKLGVVFDSSTCFRLPNLALRSPDVAWIAKEKWQSLSATEREKFPPICPDFVIELRSSSDSLQSLQEKMAEYLDNGTRLGWLINPQDKQIEIYRLDREKEILQDPINLSGEDVLVGFVLDLADVL